MLLIRLLGPVRDLLTRTGFYARVGMHALFASTHDAVLYAIYNSPREDYLTPSAPASDEDILVRFDIDPSQNPTLYVSCFMIDFRLFTDVNSNSNFTQKNCVWQKPQKIEKERSKSTLSSPLFMSRLEKWIGHMSISCELSS
jgi:hypothetical protein